MCKPPKDQNENGKIHEKLNEEYYKPGHLWVGGKAIRKLFQNTGISKKKIKSSFAQQALWQIHIPPTKDIEHPHYQVTIPNQLHQFDLLYMPHDVVYGSTYKYILTGVDVASRYIIARPLCTKKASDVEFLLKTIYEDKKIPLNYPTEFRCDNGSEFKADVTKLLEKHNVKIRRATTKYRHTFTAFVEIGNKRLSKPLFKIQDAQELNNPTKDSKIWVKHLYNVVDELNKDYNSVIKMTPEKARKLKELKLHHKPYPKEDILPTDGLYSYLWFGLGILSDLIESLKTPVNAFYIIFVKERAFVKEELMLIPEDTEVPPDHVKKW